MVVKLERKRYILTEFWGQVPDKKELIYELRDKIGDLVGQFGLATSSIHVVEMFDNYAIIRCTNESRDIVETAIQLLTGHIPVVRIVTGTIKKIRGYVDED